MRALQQFQRPDCISCLSTVWGLYLALTVIDLFNSRTEGSIAEFTHRLTYVEGNKIWELPSVQLKQVQPLSSICTCLLLNVKEEEYYTDPTTSTRKHEMCRKKRVRLLSALKDAQISAICHTWSRRSPCASLMRMRASSWGRAYAVASWSLHSRSCVSCSSAAAASCDSQYHNKSLFSCAYQHSTVELSSFAALLHF